MSFSSLIKRIFFPDTYSESAYISALKNKYHIDIGDHCKIWSPNQTHIDTQRPHMLHIGDYVKITRNVTILCHDYSRGVLCQMDDYENVGEARETYIGDNVFIGMNATILMGSHIGNNSIVGAGSVVSGSFEDGLVIAGNPARAICSIEDYYKRHKALEVSSAKLYVRKWREKYHRDPNVVEMTNAFAWLYLPRLKETIEEYPQLFRLSGVDENSFIVKFMNSKPIYSSFEEFLEDCR